jgi:hypothetical protein
MLNSIYDSGRWLWAVVGRELGKAWLWLRDPGKAAFYAQLRAAGMRIACEIVPPKTPVTEVLAWFQSRVATAEPRSPLACTIYRLPTGVHPNRQGWQQQAELLVRWGGVRPDWEEGGRVALVGALPASCPDRLRLNILYHIPPDDDGGTPERHSIDGRLRAGETVSVPGR